MRAITRCVAVVSVLLAGACLNQPKSVPENPAVKAERAPHASFDSVIDGYRKKMFDEGRHTFRHETFGSEAFFGGTLQLQKAILGDKSGGVGAGVSPMD